MVSSLIILYLLYYILLWEDIFMRRLDGGMRQFLILECRSFSVLGSDFII